MVARAGEVAGFPFQISSHVLRHSCGYKLANDGRDTRSIQRYLGHRSIVSTVRYTSLRPIGSRILGRIDADNRERAGTLTPRLQSRTPSVAPLMPRHRYDAPTIWLIVRINP
jgi:integrase